MIEEFVHGKHSSTALDKSFHFHQSELIQSVGPDIEGVALLGDDLCQPIVKCSG